MNRPSLVAVIIVGIMACGVQTSAAEDQASLDVVASGSKLLPEVGDDPA